MEEGLVLIALLFAILQIVLFFKIWRMCNDVHNIADKYVHGEATMTKQERHKNIKEGKTPPETRAEMDAWLSGKSLEEDK